MPAYKFEALDAAGKSSTGLLDAENAKAARAQLRAQALVPLAVTQVASAGTAGQGLQFKRRVFTSTSLAVWTRQLAGLVGAGLPLERARSRVRRASSTMSTAAWSRPASRAVRSAVCSNAWPTTSRNARSSSPN